MASLVSLDQIMFTVIQVAWLCLMRFSRLPCNLFPNCTLIHVVITYTNYYGIGCLKGSFSVAPLIIFL